MSEMNPDQDWAAQALQNQNRPPSPPAMRAGNTTGCNPFCRSTRGTYRLNQTHGAVGRMLNPMQTPTTQLSQYGSGRPSPPYSRYTGTNPWNTASTTDTPISNYQTPLWSETQYPPMRSPTLGNFPGHVQDHYDQRSAIASPFPRRPGGASTSWTDQFLAMGTGQMRTATLIPPMSPDPLSDEEDFQTPRPSPVQSLTLSQTRIHTDQTTTPSTQEDQTMSGPSFRRSTKKSLVPTEVQPGNSDNETSSSGSSGPTLGIHESRWTSTWLLKVATQSWGNTPTPAWPRGYMPTRPETSTHQTAARGFPMHDYKQMTNRRSSKLTFAPWQSSMRSGLPSRGFRLDEETFGAAIRDDDATLNWNMVGPMLDSPPQRNRRQRDQYHGKGTSRLIAGADDDQMEGGSGQPLQQPPMNPQELAEHYAATLLQIAQLRNSENDLHDQLAATQQPDRGRQP
ncbi:hypothetical protein ARMGADRAFT_1033980 [Armillaria gallica]|uniref:Uncharacterized protein n=1 Tax=Armillaria gallica TaxID=47427 RepID=A0A2H3D072_ARMGA|nr:hypothetical protein ARMGADRAFT_1033980 [Armillaria gallica]